MKNLGLTCLLLISLCAGLQAKKIVKKPYFMGNNTQSLEIEKVVLGKDTTWVEVEIYGRPGEQIRIDSAAVLRVSGKDYAYIGSAGFSQAKWTHLSVTGSLSATLKFAPIPVDAESFDFIEIPADGKGWNIYGVCLDGKKPEVDIPQRLIDQKLDYSLPLPIPELKCGKSVIEGKLLGYKPEYGTKVTFNNSHWFFYDFFGKKVSIDKDGTFRYETDVLMPCGGVLRIGNYRLNLFLIPGGQLNITLNLPEMFMSQSHIFGKERKTEAEKWVWFEGDYAGLNTELFNAGDKMKLIGQPDFFSDICGISPLAYKKYVLKIYKTFQRKLDKQKDLSQACRTYVKANMDMGLFSAITSYKNNISYAPMISGKKGVKRADMTIDSISYFKEILDLDILHSPYQKYYEFYTDFVRLATGAFADKFVQEPLWKDIMLSKRASRSLNKQMPLTETEFLLVDSISIPEFRQLLLDKNEELEAKLEAAKHQTGYTIIHVEKEIEADSILQAVTLPYRGKMILIDMWNTWCAPCMRAMESLKPLKKELNEVVYLYIADESSPEGKWILTIPDIEGIHCRITNEQSTALRKLYDYPGIPTYFVINREGKIMYKATGFPGIEKLRENLVATP